MSIKLMAKLSEAAMPLEIHGGAKAKIKRSGISFGEGDLSTERFNDPKNGGFRPHLFPPSLSFPIF